MPADANGATRTAPQPPAAFDFARAFNSPEANLHAGMGQAVAERTVLRKIFDFYGGLRTVSADDPNLRLIKAGARKRGLSLGVDQTNQTPHWLWRWETWGEVAERVAAGNTALDQDRKLGTQHEDYARMARHVGSGVLLMSGRHLQHGDLDQPNRNLEVFTNCATAPATFLSFKLLLNGSGVGRAYDDDMMLTNWDFGPNTAIVLDHTHPDFDWEAHESVREAQHKYRGKDVFWHEVEDSREGWAKALEVYERAAFEKVHKDKVLVLDFSKVREKGAPIGGMQDRPASGPVPLMAAFQKAATIKGAGLPKWMQALYIDHYFAECVLVGGARRAARMATKWWADAGIFDFIQAKRPVEFYGKTMTEVVAYREQCTAKGTPPPMPFLWSANNSVMVDGDFWAYVKGEKDGPLKEHAQKVARMIAECAYGDGTGEPGIINAHRLKQDDTGWSKLVKGEYVGSAKYQPDEDTLLYLSRLAKRAKRKPYHMTTNPCSEIALVVLGGYCTIADVAPFMARSLEEVEDAVQTAVRALIRVNTMDSTYRAEVERTNRIGVSLTGVVEAMWLFFRIGFRDALRPDWDAYAENPVQEWAGNALDDVLEASVGYRAAAWWAWLSHLSNAAVDEAKAYSAERGVVCPHTILTVKPAGTTSKLFGLCEGWHLPSKAWYLRWVQFRSDDPLVAEYKAKGYPTRDLKSYSGTTIVGFPTQPVIGAILPEEKLVTAAQATPQEQYEWLHLGERFWLHGEDPTTGKQHNYGNQISYTLKYDPETTDFEEFYRLLIEGQSRIKCCSIMPQADVSAYEYQPEESVTKARFEEIAYEIENMTAGAETAEKIGLEHLECGSGACPI